MAALRREEREVVADAERTFSAALAAMAGSINERDGELCVP